MAAMRCLSSPTALASPTASYQAAMRNLPELVAGAADRDRGKALEAARVLCRTMLEK
jgi:hypothetical protein